MKPLDDQNYYEILEIEPDATEEQIRQAYERLIRAYNPQAPGIHALFSPEDVTLIRSKIEEAHQILINPRTRRQYDEHLEDRSAGTLQTAAATPAPVAQPRRRLSPSEVDGLLQQIGPRVTGDVFRRIREALSLTVADVAQETKISKSMIHAIEEEYIASFPASVYLKGFIKAYAKALSLNPEQAALDYLDLIATKGYQD
jgi:curved DNA-binding protein CbpA